MLQLQKTLNYLNKNLKDPRLLNDAYLHTSAYAPPQSHQMGQQGRGRAIESPTYTQVLIVFTWRFQF